MSHFISDIFGNQIEVTNLPAALEQCRMYAGIEITEDSPVQWIPEYRLVSTVDNQGKAFKCQRETHSGRQAGIQEFWQHQLDQLEKLAANAS